MKKLLFLTLAALLVSATYAGGYAGPAPRDDGNPPKNEVSVSYGWGSAYYLTGVLVRNVLYSFRLDVDEMKSMGTAAVDYRHYLNGRWAIGGTVCYEASTLPVARLLLPGTGNEAVVDGTMYRNIAIMPAVTLRWLQDRHVSIYSKLALGVMLQIDPEGPVSAAPCTCLTPVGTDFGGRSVRGFLEMNVGTQSLLSAGVKFRF